MLFVLRNPRKFAKQIIIAVLFLVAYVLVSDLRSVQKEAILIYENLERVKVKVLERTLIMCNGTASKNKVPNVIKTYLARSTTPPPPQKPACAALLEGSEEGLKQAKIYMSYRPMPEVDSPQKILADLLDCDDFVRSRGYAQLPGSVEEAEFPIAFSIMIHKDAWQAERLLRNIYQPQNHYCFHVDAKAKSDIMRVVLGLSRCLPNVFLVSKQESIVYASINRLQAELNCLKDLLWAKPAKKWQYFINLTGQMFPLRSNLELVKILKIYNGANDIEGLPIQTVHSEYISKRWKFEWHVHGERLQISSNTKEPPPDNIKLVKGSAYGTFSREFLEYALTSNITRSFLDWCKDTYSPDEFYWATLHHTFVNPMFQSPGGYDGAPDRKPWLASYSAWQPVDKCAGRFVRSICIFGVGDLPSLVSRKELFANKFYWDYEYLTLDCLEEWVQNKTTHNLPLDLYHYKQLPFVKSKSL